MGVIADHMWLWQEGRMGLIPLQCVNCTREDLKKQQTNLCDYVKINLPDGLCILTIELLCNV